MIVEAKSPLISGVVIWFMVCGYQRPTSAHSSATISAVVRGIRQFYHEQHILAMAHGQCLCFFDRLFTLVLRCRMCAIRRQDKPSKAILINGFGRQIWINCSSGESERSFSVFCVILSPMPTKIHLLS